MMRAISSYSGRRPFCKLQFLFGLSVYETDSKVSDRPARRKTRQQARSAHCRFTKTKRNKCTIFKSTEKLRSRKELESHLIAWQSENIFENDIRLMRRFDIRESRLGTGMRRKFLKPPTLFSCLLVLILPFPRQPLRQQASTISGFLRYNLTVIDWRRLSR